MSERCLCNWQEASFCPHPDYLDCPVEEGEFFAYHGTSEENGKSILVEGFNEDSWFARDIPTAQEHGGPFIIAVRFDGPRPRPDDGQDEWWQFHTYGWRVPVQQIAYWGHMSDVPAKRKKRRSRGSPSRR